MKKGLYIALIVLLVTAFCGSAFYLGNYFIQGKKQADRMKELSDIVKETTPSVTETTPASGSDAEPTAPEKHYEISEAPTEANGMLSCYKKLYDENPDIVGWIRIEGTPVDYPVMQTAVDNKDYYLYRDFDGKNADRGSIYAREECDFFAPSDVITMYGHNMRDGSMFACLDKYYDKSVWEENSLIFLDTLYEFHMYKIFAVFKTSATVGEGFRYNIMEDASSSAEFDNFIGTCKRLAFYDTGITPVYGDKIIMLSTCEYTLDNGRCVVAAVRIS